MGFLKVILGKYTTYYKVFRRRARDRERRNDNEWARNKHGKMKRRMIKGEMLHLKKLLVSTLTWPSPASDKLSLYQLFSFNPSQILWQLPLFSVHAGACDSLEQALTGLIRRRPAPGKTQGLSWRLDKQDQHLPMDSGEPESPRAYREQERDLRVGAVCVHICTHLLVTFSPHHPASQVLPAFLCQCQERLCCFVKPRMWLCLPGMIYAANIVLLLPRPGDAEAQQAGGVNEYLWLPSSQGKPKGFNYP